LNTTLELHDWEKIQRMLGLTAPPAKAASKPARRSKADGHRVSAGARDHIEDLVHTPCKDGERTAHLTKLIGVCLAYRLGEAESLAKCREWNAQNTEPLDDEKVVSTFDSLLKTDQRNHPDRYEETAAIPLGFRLEDGRIGRFLDHEPPPRRWLLKDVLVLGKTGIVVAPGGTSKSQLLLQLAVGVATGLPVADYWEIGEQGSVMVLSAEDDDDELHRRLWRIQDRLISTGAYRALPDLEKNLFVFSTVGKNTLLTNKPDYGETEQTHLVDEVIDLASQISDLKLIVLDPASRFRGGDENKNEDATRFVQAVERIASATGATVLIAHHANKWSSQGDSNSNQGASRGASALTDGVRWQMNLSRTTDAALRELGLPEGTQMVLASVAKTNYAAYPPNVYLERGPDGYLTAFTKPQLTAAAAESEIKKVLRIIDAEVRAERAVSARTIETHFGGKKGTLNLAKHRIRELVKEMCDKSLLTAAGNGKLTLTEAGRLLLGGNKFEVGGASKAEIEDAPEKPNKNNDLSATRRSRTSA